MNLHACLRSLQIPNLMLVHPSLMQLNRLEANTFMRGPFREKEMRSVYAQEYPAQSNCARPIVFLRGLLLTRVNKRQALQLQMLSFPAQAALR